MNIYIRKRLHTAFTRIANTLPFLGAALVLVAGFSLARTARYGTSGLAIDPLPEMNIPESAAERLAGSLRFRTISHENSNAFDAQEFQGLHAYLAKVFPEVYSQLRVETVDTHSLLYTWNGTDPSLNPILLSGHLDVVPIEPATKDEWDKDPFAGQIVDGFIWGRGAIDNKSAVVGTLEAVEGLLRDGFRPNRTVYLAYGHDEEVGGTQGARQISALLKSRGVVLEMVLDEGGVISDGILTGVSQPVALVGIAEKGFVSIELSTRRGGGHSSLPPKETAIGIVSAAIARLEKYPIRARLDGPTLELFDRIGPLLPFTQRAVFANLWLTRGLVVRQLESSPVTNAMVRTTAAPTIFEAGSKDNVLPGQARAVINYRILPGDRIADVAEHVRHVINDNRVQVKIAGRFSAEPSAASSTDSHTFRTLELAIRKIIPHVMVAPYLVVVATDARYYSELSSNIFRFLPLRLTEQDIERMHGTNERLAIKEYKTAIRIYRQLILDAAG
jgi:carboxypeptidase PM20D1